MRTLLTATLVLLLTGCDQPTYDEEWDTDVDGESGFAADARCCPRTEHGVDECEELLCVNDRIVCPEDMGPEGDVSWCVDPEFEDR